MPLFSTMITTSSSTRDVE